MSIEHQIVAAVRQIVRAVDLHSRRLVESVGLTGPQLATLQACRRLGPTTPSQIARAVHLSQATVTGILQRLERGGLLVRRRSDTDRRAFIVEISPAGGVLLDEAPSLLQDHFRSELAALREWERSMILATLQRVAALMGVERIDAAPHLTVGAVDAPAGDATVPPAAGPLRGARSNGRRRVRR